MMINNFDNTCSDLSQLYSNQAIGQVLKKLRIQKGLASSDLAYEADIHPSYYSMLENGRNCISVKKLSGILKVHQLPLSYFFQVLEEEAHEYSILDSIVSNKCITPDVKNMTTRTN